MRARCLVVVSDGANSMLVRTFRIYRFPWKVGHETTAKAPGTRTSAGHPCNRVRRLANGESVNRHITGWLWVAGQALLLGALILLPNGQAWDRSGALGLIGNVAFVGGLLLVGIGALRLGAGITPSPVPNSQGQLQTTGLYRFMRHPIYSGVLIAVVGIALRSGGWVHVAIAVVTFVYFDRKAAWEEGQLRDHYPTYGAYAARTATFFPGLW